MINYFFPNDYFAIVYCIGRISLLLDVKLIVCWKKNYHYFSLKFHLMSFGSF